jgi:hypothetical protein
MDAHLFFATEILSKYDFLVKSDVVSPGPLLYRM